MHRATVCFVLVLCSAASASAEIVLLGKTTISGTAEDRSGLDGKFENGTPRNRLGSHGSGIAYSGQGERYIMVADRGPSDGAVSFPCRMHFFDIAVKPGSDGHAEVKATLAETVMLKDEEGRSLVGLSSAIDTANPRMSLRFDPEGVRVGRDGNVFVSDEYGPFIYEFTPNGKRLRSLKIPEKFLIANPRAKEADELLANKSGRVPNKGMEGLAITPDGRQLIGVMHAPLIPGWRAQGNQLPARRNRPSLWGDTRVSLPAGGIRPWVERNRCRQ